MCLAFCEQLDMLIVGLSNGMIVNYTLEIDSHGVASDDAQESVSPSA